MTRRPARAGAAALLALALTSCAGVRPDPPPVDVEELVAHDLALLNAFAVEVEQRPEVLCVQTRLRQGGLTRVSPGDVGVFAVTEDLPAPAREALVRELAEQVWDLGLSDVRTLVLSVGPGGTGAQPRTDLGLVLRGPTAGPGASAADLEAAFGPRPPSTDEVPPDPGPQDC